MTALEKVPSIYIRWSLHKVSSDGNTTDYQESYCERVFAYELYHQIRLIMEPELGKIIDRYNHLLLNGEQVKSDCFFKHLFEGLSKLCEKYKDDGNNRIIPDLVLHKDLGSIDEGNQLYLVEIKMGQNQNALDDLVKLTFLKESNLGFHFYIFIYVGKTLDTLKEEIMKTNKKRLAKEIVCMCIADNQATCTTLGELLSSF